MAAGKSPQGISLFQEIPPKVPRLRIVPEGIIIFPHSPLPIKFLDKEVPPEYLKNLSRHPYFIFVPLLPNEALFPVGVMGRMRNLRKEEEYNHAIFQGLFRVIHRPPDNPDDSLVKWIAFIETDSRNDPDFRIGTGVFAGLANTFIEYLQKTMDAKDKELIFGQEFVKDALARLKRVDEENISAAIDGFMNILHRLEFEFSQKSSDCFVQKSFLILGAADLKSRLKETVDLLNILLEECQEKDKEDEENEKTNALMREDLLEARIIKKPHVPLPSLPKIPGNLISLDHKKPGAFMLNLIEYLGQYVVNQERGKTQIAKKLLRWRQGHEDPRRPLIGGFFAGPTGVGKTELVKALAEFLFDDFRNGYTHISCNSLQERHETSLLIGSPPGYVGHDKEPLLSQWNIDRPHFMKFVKLKYGSQLKQRELELLQLNDKIKSAPGEEKKSLQKEFGEKNKELKRFLEGIGYQPGGYASLILFDEVERANPAVFDLLLRILDDGVLTLMNGETTDFRNSIIFFTSNIYGREMLAEISGKGQLGFRQAQDEIMIQQEFEKRIWKEVVGAIERHFSFNPAFLGRVGKENLIVFHPLAPKDLMQILNMHLQYFFSQLKSRSGIKDAHITEEAKEIILKEATDSTNRALGARPLKKVFERLVEDPIISLLDRGSKDGGVGSGDKIWIDKDEKENKEKIIIKKLN